MYYLFDMKQSIGLVMINETRVSASNRLHWAVTTEQGTLICFYNAAGPRDNPTSLFATSCGPPEHFGRKRGNAELNKQHPVWCSVGYLTGMATGYIIQQHPAYDK